MMEKHYMSNSFVFSKNAAGLQSPSWKCLAWVGLFSALLLLTWGEARADEYHDIESAFMAQRNGDYKTALSTYTELIKSGHFSQSDKAVLFLLRGETAQSAGDLEQALHDFTEAVKQDEGYALAYYFRGLVYEEQGDLPRAFTDVKRASELEPDVERYHVKLYALKAKAEEATGPVSPSPVP